MDSYNETWLSIIVILFVVSAGVFRGARLLQYVDGPRGPPDEQRPDSGAYNHAVSLPERLLRWFGQPPSEDIAHADPSAVAAPSPGLPADRDPRPPGPQLGCLPLYGR
jgi:hypothetical protein